MKKLVTIFLLVAICAVFADDSFAQRTSAKQGPEVKTGPVQRRAPDPAAARARRSFGVMMALMTSGKMSVMDDGSVVVMIGNKLMKYDKDLNLRKEVEIKMDMDELDKMMSGQ
ncbi:MAG: hypothetical protein PVH45_04635 [Candidatus Omnitrophota bacterium]|jgi:hypothetical protein